MPKTKPLLRLWKEQALRSGLKASAVIRAKTGIFVSSAIQNHKIHKVLRRFGRGTFSFAKTVRYAAGAGGKTK